MLLEIRAELAGPSLNRRNPRGVKRKMSNFPLRPGTTAALSDISAAIRIVK